MQLYTAIHDLKGRDHKHAREQVERILKEYDSSGKGALSKDEFVRALHGDDIFSFFE
jgi:Ca2+-binding EF-hand superfamily protein